jgi:hypothetical protein
MFRLYGRAMARVASHGALNAVARGLILGQFVWDLWWTKWHWDRFFSEYFGFALSVSFHKCSTLFIYMLLLPESQKGEKAWEPSTKQCSFGNRTELDRKQLSLFFFSKGLTPYINLN